MEDSHLSYWLQGFCITNGDKSTASHLKILELNKVKNIIELTGLSDLAVTDMRLYHEFCYYSNL